MKQGTLITRIVMMIIFVSVVLYMGFYAWRGLSDPFHTILTYAFTVNDAAEATGFLVRNEVVIPGRGQIADLVPDEGEKVGVGQKVAVLYQSETALDRKASIAALQLELEQLDYAARRNDHVGDGAQLDQDITNTWSTLRASLTAGDLTGLEEDTLALRSLVLKRVDGDRTTADSVAGIEAAMAEVSGKLQGLQAASAQESSSVTADRAGVFSGLVDGYEALITPQMLETLTVADFAALSAKKVTPDETALGKLIVSSRYAFVTVLEEGDAARLQVGKTVPLLFSHDYSGKIPMRVDRIGESEGGKCVVVFSTDRALGDTTLLRRQTVDIIFEEYHGVRVPKKAVRVETQTKTDPTTKVETPQRVTGVYVLVGAQSEFKPAEVVREGEDFYLLKGTATDRRVLRPGDEVIVSTEELYTGKVVR